MKRLIDISQRLDNHVAGWPGDTPFSFSLAWNQAQSGSVNVGKIVMSIHTGTHIDAPFHFDDEGKRVIDLDLELYVGPARVIHIPATNSIGIDDVKNVNLEGVSRLLIRTGAWVNRQAFPQSIPFLEPELAVYLAQFGVRLIGLDLPSVDLLDSKELPAHHELTRLGIHILEGIVLEDVQPGDYELIALPLPLVEADGSPVRAVLREL
ncbi:kynurenine formamidase [Brevibacillus choshinensis]|uniref:Kynurenine formamidase n=1 Tax=Brevibacillus choshinensis TaxID=54911 RepID=A0ABR5NAZ9_BRECH|nr:arylformamidase [Brevibacillus choshinensis]KQL48554.1 kynurenine formamidase [Brevibacillus choshinensis]